MQQLINGNSVPISVRLLNSSGSGVTGAIVLLSLRDRATGYYFNSTSGLFESGYRTITMAEVDAVYAAGLYLYNFDNPDTNGDVLATITTAAATAINKFFEEWLCYRAPSCALTQADVEDACDAALATYDAPTKAEMDSGFSGLNNLSSSDVIDAVTTAIASLVLAVRKIAAYIWYPADRDRQEGTYIVYDLDKVTPLYTGIATDLHREEDT